MQFLSKIKNMLNDLCTLISLKREALKDGVFKFFKIINTHFFHFSPFPTNLERNVLG